MKNILMIFILFCSYISFSQNDTIKYTNNHSYNYSNIIIENLIKSATINNQMTYKSGLYLKQASSNMLVGYAFGISGSLVMGLGYEDPTLLYVGGGMVLVGVIFEIVGISKIGKSGRIMIENNKINVKF